MSSPAWSLPPVASPVIAPPSFPPPLLPPLPQIGAPSSPTISTIPPTLPPINNNVSPSASSPLLPPPLASPPPQLPPLPVLLPPETATRPPPPSVTSSPPPPSSPPPTPLPSRLSLPPPPQPPSPPPPRLLTPTPPPHVSSPTIPPNTPSPLALSPPLPPPTTIQTPPLASPIRDSPQPTLPASTLSQPPSPNRADSTIPFALPPPMTPAMTPQFALHPPSSSSLPSTSQARSPRPNISTALIAGSCVIGGLVAISLMLAILFVGYKRRRSKNKSALMEVGCHKTPSFGPKDDCYVVPAPGVHVIKVLSRTSITQSPMTRTSGFASIKSGPEIPFPPQTQRPAGSFDASNGIFTYDQMVVATNGFSEANLLGQGGFGYVHKGVLPSGKEVAVKQLKTGSRQGEREFQAEVDIISRVHHKHLVSLVGYAITGAERLLVYEFVPNNTLEFHLHGGGQPVLDWETRLKIATGSAKGLAYLHEDCNPKIIHRDIKASNILVDHNFEAKVSDFGLAKSFSDTNTNMTHFSTRVVGTFGYLAPEYASSGKVTDKSDVYSYGVVLLELITGRLPITTIDSFRNEGLVQWARPLLTQALEDGDYVALVDPQLERNYNNNEMARMVACAAACVRHSAWLRPRMSQVVHTLEGIASLTELREGITPGHSTNHNTYDSPRFREDNGISKYIETTSEYGLNPSGSSSEGRQTF